MTKNVREWVYAAESTFCAMLAKAYDFPTVEMFGSTFNLPNERKFATIENVQTYVDAVLSLNWVREKWDNATTPVKVRERKGQKSAHYEYFTNTIAIPLYERGKAWAMREEVVLHEIAHHLTGPGHDHDSVFTDILCELISELMSAEAGFILRALFHAEGCAVG